MYLLALHEDSNANATLFHDTRVVFALAEERLSRRKYQAGFPWRSLEMMLQRFNLRLKDIDVILCANKYHFLPRLLGRRFPTFQHSFLGTEQKASVYYQHALSKCGFLRGITSGFNKAALSCKLGRQVRLVHHHAAHAYSAYMTSGFETAVTISTDNYGDGLSSAVFAGDAGRCRLLYASSALNSPGQFYGEVAQVLGIHPLLAGKMTGLAAYGDPGVAYGIVKGLFSLAEDRRDFVLPSMMLKSPSAGAYRMLRNYRREDVAAAAQKRFEEVMLDYIKEAVRSSGIRQVALAGGIYGNVRLNKKIAELPEVQQLFIHPGMSDQGISLGAGLKYLSEAAGLRPFALHEIYWGPDYPDRDIEIVLKGSALPYEYHRDDLEISVAQLLSRGKVVARFAGRMEYGPRALGNRSILYQTTDSSVNDWLNRRLKRSEYMPFAPVTLAEYAHQCYKGSDKAKSNTKFMTIALDCTDWMKQVSPGVVHVDGTARPQILREDENPNYYKILKEYHRITGIPSLINTSFNMHEEPIVATPQDALRAFQAAGLEYLAIGNFLALKP